MQRNFSFRKIFTRYAAAVKFTFGVPYSSQPRLNWPPFVKDGLEKLQEPQNQSGKPSQAQLGVSKTLENRNLKAEQAAPSSLDASSTTSSTMDFKNIPVGARLPTGLSSLVSSARQQAGGSGQFLCTFENRHFELNEAARRLSLMKIVKPKADARKDFKFAEGHGMPQKIIAMKSKDKAADLAKSVVMGADAGSIVEAAIALNQRPPVSDTAKKLLTLLESSQPERDLSPPRFAVPQSNKPTPIPPTPIPPTPAGKSCQEPTEFYLSPNSWHSQSKSLFKWMYEAKNRSKFRTDFASDAKKKYQ